jgi:hypothetical protein
VNFNKNQEVSSNLNQHIVHCLTVAAQFARPEPRKSEVGGRLAAGFTKILFPPRRGASPFVGERRSFFL